MERKRTSPAKVLKAQAVRGSFRVFASPNAGSWEEIVKIETHKKNRLLAKGYVQVMFKLDPQYDAADIARCKQDRSTFIGRCYGPIPMNDTDLWYEPVHDALQNKVDAVLGVD